MNRLIDTAIGHTRTVLLTLVLVLIAGTYAYVTVPKEAEPDINIPQLYVNVSHEGISPEDAERLLIKPIERDRALGASRDPVDLDDYRLGLRRRRRRQHDSAKQGY